MYEYSKYAPPSSPPLSPVATGMLDQSDMNLSSPSKQQQQQQQRYTATAKRQKYLRRIFKFQQMDFEYAFWQMLYLFISPQKVYRNFAYRKHTKNQFARDDPAFLVLLTFWLCASSIGFAVVLKLSFIGFVKFLFWVIFVDCIGVGILVATVFWMLCNKYLILQPPRGQDVEWGYAFDVHLNAFFPLLMILHLFQLPFLNTFINHSGFLSCLLGNSLWMFAIAYYIYITFLGYSSLPFLTKTQLLLYPMTAAFLVYLATLLVGWNLSRGLCFFYKYRVL